MRTNMKINQHHSWLVTSNHTISVQSIDTLQNLVLIQNMYVQLICAHAHTKILESKYVFVLNS